MEKIKTTENSLEKWNPKGKHTEKKPNSTGSTHRKRTTQTPLKQRGELSCYIKASSFCFLLLLVEGIVQLKRKRIYDRW